MARVAVVLALFLAVVNGQGTFRLANFYQNDMVLQMEPKSAVLWGYGEVDARIEIKYEDIQIQSGVNADGTWRVVLPPHAAGGPIDFSIIHNNVETITLYAWFGDVWVCSGESNMALNITQIYNATQETNNALRYQNIRLLKVQRTFSLDSEYDEVSSFATPWSAPSAKLIRTLNHAMIAPLTKTAVRGAIWYQGESNVNWNADYYACHITALIQDWKSTFHDGGVPAENGIAFPFGVVQIGPTERGDDYNWGNLRFHQTADQGVLPNALIPEGFFAAAYDLTDRVAPTGDINPRDKQTVATRLANAARNLIYGENFRPYGPIPISAFAESSTNLIITFDSDIKPEGTKAFANFDGTWTDVLTIGWTTNSVRLAINLEATAARLTIAYRANVCEYKQCAIYSNDTEALPAQPWTWDLPVLTKEASMSLRCNNDQCK